MSVVRTIHHLAASGGTLLSKALAAQPKAILLSEIGPFVGQVRFNPFDPVQQFIRRYLAVDDKLLPGVHRGLFARKVLADRIRLIHEIASESGYSLIVRDHAHSDLMRRVPNSRSSLLLALAEGGLKSSSIVTVRDPVDSWLSSRENGWLHEVDSFDEYCRRFLLLVRHFEADRIFRYEDFVRDPENTTQAICFALELDFDPQFATRMSTIRLTGDSGRKSDEIASRPRRTMPPEIVREVLASAHYAEISNQLGYGLQGSVEKE